MAEAAPPIALGLTPEVPFDPGVNSYIRFASAFEAAEYTGWQDECMSWKKTCYIGDWSPLNNKYWVKGPDALRFFSDISVNSMAKFAVGQAKHSIQCNEAGQVVCEGVLMRLDEDEFLFTCGPTVWTEYQFERGNYDAQARQLGNTQFIKQVQGPNSLAVLEKVTGDDLRDIGFMRFRRTQIGNLSFNILRQGMSGELGYELHGDSADGVAIHQAILDAGQEFGIRRLGGRTKMINHAEACFPTPTVDYQPAMFFDDDYLAFIRQRMPWIVRPPTCAGSNEIADHSEHCRNPFELGWGKNVKFDHDFIGRAALERIAADPKRTIVTLVWDKEDVIDVFASLFEEDGDPYAYMEFPRGQLGNLVQDKVMVAGKQVGVTTSRCYSLHFRKMISLCTIDLAHAEPGTRVEVIWGNPGTRQKRIKATVAPAPFKRDNRRMDVAQLAATDQPA